MYIISILCMDIYLYISKTVKFGVSVAEMEISSSMQEEKKQLILRKK